MEISVFVYLSTMSTTRKGCPCGKYLFSASRSNFRQCTQASLKYYLSWYFKYSNSKVNTVDPIKARIYK